MLLLRLLTIVVCWCWAGDHGTGEFDWLAVLGIEESLRRWRTRGRDRGRVQHRRNFELDEVLVDDLSGKGGKVDLQIYASSQSRLKNVGAVKRTREGGNAANSWPLHAVHETKDIEREEMGSHTDWTLFLFALLPSGITVLSTDSLGRFEPEAPM